ncbi:MAG TPA: MFS transporter, partial [Sulfitobacter sp.]|nr:MFS transporter [Sulfitobacter sp.]
TQVQVRARDNFSIYEQDALVRQVEQRLFTYDEIASVYARTGSSNRDSADLIGTIQVEFTEWDERRTAAMIGEEIRTEMAAIPGIDVQVQTASNGPSAGKPVNLRIKAHDAEVQQQVVNQIREKMSDIGG